MMYWITITLISKVEQLNPYKQQEAKMAYITQEQKKVKETKLKPILKKYGISARLGIDNNNTLVMNITKGKIDFLNIWKNTSHQKVEIPEKLDYLQVNPYWYKDQFLGEALNFLIESFEVLNEGNHNNSDIQSDYFDIGFYVDVNIGKWNKPYQLTT